MEIDIEKLTIQQAREDMSNGSYTAVDLAEACLGRIHELNPQINAFIEVFDDVLEQAREADKRIQAKESTPLLGIPLAVKDNMLIEGKVSSSASKILKTYKATYSAEAIKRLQASGAVLLGRANMDEFAMGSSTESSAYGVTKNPHDLTRVPGGSSGGSAAALAAGMCLGALGSDTGGSIRQPASFCGVVGLKPTYGAVSRSGLMAMASSLDQIGPFAKTSTDAEAIYRVIAGHDTMDSTSLPDNVIKESFKGEENVKYTIGVPETFLSEGVDSEVLKSFYTTLDTLKEKGHTIVPVELPTIKHSLAVYYIIMPAEVSTNLARYDGVKYALSREGENIFDSYEKTRAAGFGDEVRRRVLLGTYVLSAGYHDAYYNKAVALRQKITRDFSEAFKKVDAIVTPTAPTVAFKLGEKTDDPVQMYLADIFTVPANIAGIPAISLPSGRIEKDGASLPVGFHIMAGELKENVLFGIGKDIIDR